MLHYWSLDHLNLRGTWLTIGSFDGVHLGHQAIIQRIIQGAHAEGIYAAAITFYPHPAAVLGKQEGAFYLSTPEEKAELLAESGLDILITHSFNRRVAGLSARDFVRRLKEHLGFRRLCVGEDFALGHNREGNVAYLRQLGDEFGFEIEVMKPVEMDGEIISSSRVRKALEGGDMATIQQLLGRPYQLRGEVVHGDDRGKSLGFPTANLEVWSKKALPRAGVYAGWAYLDGEEFPAVSNVGFRPTFENALSKPRVEAYLLGLNRDIYHQQLSLSFNFHLRDEARFASVEELVEQIRKDVQKATRLLELERHETISGSTPLYP
jgi:riboflavin kinase/FMN adenylyltransferase